MLSALNTFPADFLLCHLESKIYTGYLNHLKWLKI